MNPRMLVVARESRGLTQKALAEISGVAPSTLWKAESGITELSGERLEKIATALHYPVELFGWPDQVYGFGSASFHHRKQQGLGQATLRRIHARVNLLRMQLARLYHGIDIKAPFQIPALDIDDYGSAAEAARAVRAAWMLPMGPVSNLISTLEAAGAIIVRRDLGSQRIAAISMRVPDERPLFVLNEGMPPDRERFTLGHETGHMVLHEYPGPNAEKEADQFASEFLMPANEIRPYLADIDLARAAALKQHWRTSMSSLIRRARDLERITDSRYRSLCVQMSTRGFTRNEPVELFQEKPTVVDAIIRIHFNDHGYSTSDLATAVALEPEEFTTEYAAKSNGPLRVIK